jgi:hypothetical protein
MAVQVVQAKTMTPSTASQATVTAIDRQTLSPFLYSAMPNQLANRSGVSDSRPTDPSTSAVAASAPHAIVAAATTRGASRPGSGERQEDDHGKDESHADHCQDVNRADDRVRKNARPDEHQHQCRDAKGQDEQ